MNNNQKVIFTCMKKTMLLVLVATIFAACSTQKEVIKVTVTPPEGIEFTKVENFKGFLAINLPYSGKGFEKNQTVSVLKNQTDAGVFVPGVKYENNNLIFWSSINETEGNLDVQYEIVKKRFINHLIKENSELIVEKKTINKTEVAFIKLITPMKSGSVKYLCGYIVPHKNKAALFLISDALISPENVQLYNNNFEPALNYIVRTVEFQEM